MLEKRNFVICFVISVAGICFFGIMRGELAYFGDASNYYTLAKSFEQNGIFSFFNMGESIRGYVFPFLIYCALKVGSFLHISDWHTILVLNSVFFSLILLFFLPSILGCAKYKTAGDIIRRMIPAGFMVLF